MTLPAITDIRQEEDRVTACFALPPELDVFQGHFPDMPILPGVAQLDWAIRLAVRYFGLAEPVAREFQVKFSDVIRPGALLSLTLRMDRVKQRLSFEYRLGERVMSSGWIKLAGTP